MHKPRIATILCLFVLLVCAPPSFQPGAQAQQQANTQDAAKLYDQAQQGLKKGAFAKALKAIEEVLTIEPENAAAYLIKGQALLGVFAEEYSKDYARGKQDLANDAFVPVKQTVESYEKYLKLKPDAVDADYWKREIEFYRPYAELTEKEKPGRTVFLTNELGDTKARLLKRPLPAYTEDARRAGVSGSVLVLALLSYDQKIGNIFVINQLSHGLTERAIEATTRVRFEPATKDGHPVSQVVAVEYSFRLN